MTLNVFFSYDSDDRLIVGRIKDGLEARAGGLIDIYIYEEDLQPGTDIPTKAKSQIREADIFLVLITPNSQDSAWVQQEVGFANRDDCTVLPIRLETPDPPELKGLLGGMEYFTFDQDDPNAFFDDFMDYAAETWDVYPDEGGPLEGDGPEKRYLSPLASPKEEEIVITESPVKVYRRDDDSHEVVAETPDQIVDLGIRDASVSRKRDGPAPVVFESNESGVVTIYNNGTTNPITVTHDVGVEPTTIQTGEAETFANTCTVEIGYNTKLKLKFGHDTIDIEESGANRM